MLFKKSSLTTKNVSKKSSHNTKDVNDIEVKLNLILEKIIIYYLNNTSYGQKIQKKLDLCIESLKHKILSGVPPEKLIPFLETIDANIQKIAEILQNVDKGIDIISNKKKAFEAAVKKLMTLDARARKFWYTHDINIFSVLWNGIMDNFFRKGQTHVYKSLKAQREIDRIKHGALPSLNFGLITKQWYKERFPKGITERDIINDSNSVLCLLDNKSIKQSISFNVFDPAPNSLETYHVFISKEENGSYSIANSVGKNMFDQERSVKKEYNKDGTLLTEPDYKEINAEQQKMSKIIDDMNKEFMENNFDIETMYNQLEKGHYKQQCRFKKIAPCLLDGMNMSKKIGEDKIKIKKIFNTPGFSHYTTDLTCNRENIKKIFSEN